MEDLKCTGECAGVDGYSTVGTWGSSCECALYHGTFDCCDIHVTRASYLCVRQLNLSVNIYCMREHYYNRLYNCGFKTYSDGVFICILVDSIECSCLYLFTC